MIDDCHRFNFEPKKNFSFSHCNWFCAWWEKPTYFQMFFYWLWGNWGNHLGSRQCERPTVLPFLSLLQFNFVGKLLGPRGNSMKRLQEETGAKMSILGKGSMRDKGKVRWLVTLFFFSPHVLDKCNVSLILWELLLLTSIVL